MEVILVWIKLYWSSGLDLLQNVTQSNVKAVLHRKILINCPRVWCIGDILKETRECYPKKVTISKW